MCLGDVAILDRSIPIILRSDHNDDFLDRRPLRSATMTTSAKMGLTADVEGSDWLLG